MKITLYTNPGCIPCKGVKSWLNRHAPAFEVIDLSENPEAKDYVRSLGYSSTPVTVIESGSQVIDIHGFAINELSEAINDYAHT